jgi:hypothetical protein
MPWTYVWRVPTTDKDHEVKLELGLLGRERLTVDGVAVSDSVSWKMRRRLPVPLGAGHSAGLDVSMARLWPETSLSVDGKTVEPTTRPRVPLWGWAYALFCAAIIFAPPGTADIPKGALRGGIAGLAVGSVLFASAGSSQVVGVVVGAFVTIGAWALVLALK